MLCLDKTGTITTGRPILSGIDIVDSTSPAWVALAALALADPEPNLTLRAVRSGCASVVVPGDWLATSTMPFSSQRKWGGADFGPHGTWVLGAPDVLASGSGGAASTGPRPHLAARQDDPICCAQTSCRR